MYDWTPVIKSIVDKTVKAGFKIVGVDNGDGRENTTIPAEAIEKINAVDESYLFIEWPDGVVRWVYIVLGNSPEETIADWSLPKDGPDLFDAVQDEFFAEWEGKETPTL